MSNFVMNITKPIDAGSLANLNQKKGIVLTGENVSILNTSYYKKKDAASLQNNGVEGDGQKNIQTGSTSKSESVNIKHITLPSLTKKVSKGQKVPINFSSKKIKVNFGWNVNNPACDVDVSAFLLSGSGKVVGDDYFVFYGQKSSPEKSVLFKNVETANVLEVFDIDTGILNPSVAKIVFVMTINDALENSLNFSMLKDAYIQIVDSVNNTELASFLVEEYYNNINSMMMGEIYLHNGAWKFNAIGNGVNKDLAGLCEFYGVAVE
ncbi:bacterial stress protein [Lachnoanaerobaculum saburreum F0468]|uniref:Bacterial stress protein n=1 Tax=Lachnoanaerobaculum saburreum F0468 TaxID=1095750 RepID=I0R769_9FIRM|nr:TerD family protein [Lachnoanaerobaculum saburreum]EIC95527.1 bacterial stress protein [Lachnoanaerobaculum saburreum F0468]